MGQDETRKATDVLLDLESKMDNILDLIRNLDLTSKLNSNKLNDIIARLEKQETETPKFTVEAVQNIPLPNPNLPPGFKQLPAGDPERVIPFVAENSLPQEDSPQGFRRNSRPETYVKEKDFPMYGGEGKQFPTQIPQMPTAPASNVGSKPPPGRGTELPPEIMAPPAATSIRKGPVVPQVPQMPQQSMPQSSQGQVPIVQRCVDKNGKSIFLANVQISDLNTNQPVFKTRTNGMGKWMASLGVGSYRVEINKGESLGKDKMQAVQDIHIDGSVPKVDLPMLIIK